MSTKLMYRFLLKGGDSREHEACVEHDGGCRITGSRDEECKDLLDCLCGGAEGQNHVGGVCRVLRVNKHNGPSASMHDKRLGMGANQEGNLENAKQKCAHEPLSPAAAQSEILLLKDW